MKTDSIHKGPAKFAMNALALLRERLVEPRRDGQDRLTRGTGRCCRRRYRELVLACSLPVLLGFAALVVRGAGRYSPPDFGGPEPKANHDAALEILQRGRTDMTFHPTGYAYFTALVYMAALREPISVLVVQIFMLPVVVLSVREIAKRVDPGSIVPATILAVMYYPFAYYAIIYTSIFPAFVMLTISVALFVPLLEARMPISRSVLAGLCLGVATCLRPNLGAVGLVMGLALLVATRQLREAVVRIVPVAIVALTALTAMMVANPPESGQFMRGSQGFNRSLLQGTYQYEYRWWDWNWFQNEGDPSYEDYKRHVARIEHESGATMVAPESQKIVAREAWRRITDRPGHAMKKAAISAVRIWILIPTQLSSMPAKIAIACQEFLLLGLAIVGVLAAWRRSPQTATLLLGITVVIGASHLLLHVEPRYGVPAKGVHVALAATGLTAILRKLNAGSSTHGP